MSSMPATNGLSALTDHTAIDLAGRFMELHRAAKVPGIVEGVVRPTDIATESVRRLRLMTAAAEVLS